MPNNPQVILAREFLKTTAIGEKQVKYIVEQARRGRVQGHRAELFAVRCYCARPAKACILPWTCELSSRRGHAHDLHARGPKLLRQGQPQAIMHLEHARTGRSSRLSRACKLLFPDQPDNGLRAPNAQVRVAKASAALEGRDSVSPEDVQKAVKLVILPRSDLSQMNQPQVHALDHLRSMPVASEASASCLGIGDISNWGQAHIEPRKEHPLPNGAHRTPQAASMA